MRGRINPPTTPNAWPSPGSPSTASTLPSPPASGTKRWQATRKLGDDRLTQHCYNAARAAALAAAGQGQDEPPLDEAAKAKLRRQALDWLKAELTAWSKLRLDWPSRGH